MSGQYYKLSFQAKVDYYSVKYETVVFEKASKEREVVYFRKTS